MRVQSSRLCLASSNVAESVEWCGWRCPAFAGPPDQQDYNNGMAWNRGHDSKLGGFAEVSR